eukprot:scaffold1052_cov339-Pavlova_lutheri.AAC.7
MEGPQRLPQLGTYPTIRTRALFGPFSFEWKDVDRLASDPSRPAVLGLLQEVFNICVAMWTSWPKEAFTSGKDGESHGWEVDLPGARHDLSTGTMQHAMIDWSAR